MQKQNKRNHHQIQTPLQIQVHNSKMFSSYEAIS
jgi:hypothetical protein